MGDEVSKQAFSAQDYLDFERKLEQETAFVHELFAARRFDNVERRLGYELELCLLDQNGAPAPLNNAVLTRANNKLLTYELARFNLEINGNAFAVCQDVFSQIDADLSDLYQQVESASTYFGIQPGLFGVLPSLCDEHLQREGFMSDMYRYRLLNERLMTMRERPVHLDIQGADHLVKDKDDVMLEALGTSLQIHYQLPFDDAVDGFHAALWASMAVVGVAANSPLVLGRECWQESRIAIFKQAVDTRNPAEIRAGETPRVHLARGYIGSWLELFDDNLRYSPILPEVLDRDIESLHHFNLHNGTIWRWVRPIIGVDSQAGYHLRLELRVAPAGPTRIDTMANLVFYVGLLEGLRRYPQNLTRVPYPLLEQDFYKAARLGLDAEVSWCDGSKGRLQEHLVRSGISLATEGLQWLGVENSEKWLEIIRERASSGRTGARWISECWRINRDTQALTRRYLELANADLPVHLWPEAGKI